MNTSSSIFIKTLKCFSLQLQLRVVDLRLHGGGVRHRLSGSLGSDVPVQSGRGHRRASAMRGGQLCRHREVTHADDVHVRMRLTLFHLFITTLFLFFFSSV